MNHQSLRSIFDEVQSIARVGASSNPERDSYKVMKFLQDNGFDIYPVNPNLANTKILGQKCYENLEAIEEKIDMVDIFRAIEHIPSITNETIKIKAKILWMQEGLYSKEVESIAKNVGLTVVMNKCPKKILEKIK